jgi:hypothetical protein
MISTGDTAANADRFGVRPISLTRVAALSAGGLSAFLRKYPFEMVAAPEFDDSPDVVSSTGSRARLPVARIGQCAPRWLVCANYPTANAFIRTMINRGGRTSGRPRAGLSSQYGLVFDPRR